MMNTFVTYDYLKDARLLPRRAAHTSFANKRAQDTRAADRCSYRLRLWLSGLCGRLATRLDPGPQVA